MAETGMAETGMAGTEMAETERTGRLSSGDVSIFYRVFGAPGRTPILCMHGSNYFDSYDWLGICRKLAGDRETASFDKRGFGETTWSKAKNYSADAQMRDMLAVLDKLGWQRPIVVGHSSSGRLSIAFAANYPERISALVIVDSAMTRDEGGPRTSTGNKPLVFASVEAAMAHFGKLKNPPRVARDRDRAERALKPVESGFMLRRDPDFENSAPQGADAGKPARTAWQQLADIACPILIVRGLRSDRWPPDILAPIQRDYPNIQWATLDTQHDVPYQDPDGLVAAVRKFAG
jgi:pimeloyl-ACP methyl ester carboxylesterase